MSSDFCTRFIKTSSIWQESILPGIFLGFELVAGGFWKGDIPNAPEIFPRRINAREVLTPQRREQFIFPVADGTAKLPGTDYEFRVPTPRREQTERSEVFSEKLQGEPGESQPTETADDAEARADFRSIQGDFIYRHHNEARVQLCVPEEETFPIPLKYIDVTRSTYTDLDVMQEKTLMTNEMSTRTETCQFLGKVSRSLVH